jgi:lysophospholipase L1-like esterase
MLTPYAKSSIVNSKLNISDTGMMLSSYIKSIDVASGYLPLSGGTLTGNLSVNPTGYASSRIGRNFSINSYSTTLGGGFGGNLYYDGTNWRYINNGYGNMLWSGTGGEMAIYTAPSGTAGNVAAITPKFTVANNGDLTITGTSNFNSYFQVNSNSDTYWGSGLNGQLSWDGTNMIINTLNSKLLVLKTNGNNALSFDLGGNGTFRGQVKAQAASDSNTVPILGQIYPVTKKWVIFGDSFSEGDTRYWGVVRDKLELTGIVTQAVSGNTISQQSTKLDSILTATPTYFNAFNICSILIGINDFAGSTTLGNYSDTAGQATYAGYMRHMIESILTANPKIELYIMTPPEADGAGVAYKATNSAGWTVKQMSELIKQICNDYSVQVIDLYNLVQFNEFTIPTLTEDGLHPNSEGAKFLGNIIANAFVNRNNAPYATVDFVESKTTTGTAAPTTTPIKIGDEFIDTTNKKLYKAMGTSSSSDWVLVN